MKRSDLLKIGIKDEYAEKLLEIMAEERKGLIPRERFNHINNEFKKAKKLLSKREEYDSLIRQNIERIKSLEEVFQELYYETVAKMNVYKKELEKVKAEALYGYKNNE